MSVTFGILGPVAAWDGEGHPIALRGPRHRAVLARLVVARGRVVPVGRLVEDLWADPPSNAVGAIRTFVAALRRALEPERRPRTPARLLVTVGPGYALHTEDDRVDGRLFEQLLSGAAALPPEQALPRLEQAMGCWRGPALADFPEEIWARTERSRLSELRLSALERQAEARLALGRASDAVPDLDAHVSEHPWREDAWRLLALALYRSGRQGEALAVLTRARTLLVEQLGIDPGPALRRLETDILAQDHRLDPAEPSGSPGRVWAEAAAAYDRTLTAGPRARLESTVDLLRNLAVTGGGGLEAARKHRLATISAAEEFGDCELTARVIGSYDVPAIWTRADDPQHSADVIASAERTLMGLQPGEHESARARLLTTIALESRGTPSARALQAARQAEQIARRLQDPALLAFALNGVFMQTFYRAGLSARRDSTGAEVIALAARHGLVTYEVLGHLIRVQARSAVADFAGAERHAAAADRLAERNELPLVGVFTQWYRALRLAATGPPPEAEAACRAAAGRLEGVGMPGVERGLLPLALLCLRVQHRQPAQADERADWGPHRQWAAPLVLLAEDRRTEAEELLDRLPDPPPGLLYEALWCLVAQAAVTVSHRAAMERAHAALLPAEAELAGAGSGVLTCGSVRRHLHDLATALKQAR
ncbi:SARP family transcriptional regulator [Streptomyces inhibens]|uniref:SARP family transcriptional regulator n=1 Tax=Streptomyces inhibens TaxID=2293571 RepID=A0A371Q3G3_STRIH|nr:BTAD domain-containing putative transcriptional regulator [Streptomyces inhibens]REK89264.1 SARP family transcriptional regulator [Streptomyces inhibens]